MKKNNHLRTRSRQGFSLVLTLSVMAMLLLMCIGAAAFLTVELKVAHASTSLAKARLNAMVGARVALGEIQRLLGPDQRVSATADILASTPGATDLVHPRWTGVWHSGKAERDDQPGVRSTVLERNPKEGHLTDTRLVGGTGGVGSSRWKTDRAKSRRMLGWLVSGNESRPLGDKDYLRPDSALNASDEIVYETVLGGGALGANFNPQGGDAADDGMGVRARRVAFPNASGSYAYWVADEGVKSRVNLKDAFDDAPATAAAPNKRQPDPQNPANGGYFRLMVPQTSNYGAFNAGFNYDLSPVSQSPTAKLALMKDFEDMATVGVDADQVRSHYYHDITFDSRGVMCDVVNGGLKKDLTYYLTQVTSMTEPSVPATGVTNEPGVKRYGIIDSDSIIDDTVIDPDTGLPDDTKRPLAATAPRFGQLFSWVRNSPTSFNGVADIRPPSGARIGTFPYPVADFSNKTKMNNMWALPVKPVLAQVGYYVHLCYDGSSSADFNPKALIYPRVVLWNPYSTPLKLSKIRVHFAMESSWACGVRVPQKNGAPDKGFYSSYPKGKTVMPLRFEIAGAKEEILEPGETKCYVPPGKAIPINPSIPNNVGWPIPDIWSPLVAGSPADLNSYMDGEVNFSLMNGASTDMSQPSTDDIATMNDGLATYRCAIWDQFQKHNYSTNQPLEGKASAGTGDWYPFGQGQYGRMGLADGSTSERIFMLQGSANNLLEEIMVEPWCRVGNGIWSVPMSTSERAPQYRHKTVAQDQKPHPAMGQIVRLMWMNDDSLSKLSKPVARNTEINGFVSGNLLADRHMRYPTDILTWIKGQHLYHWGLYTGSTQDVDIEDSSYMPNETNNMPPFMNATISGNIRVAPVDVPFVETGLLSIGALQHMPVSHFGWAPMLAIGNSFPSTGIPTDRSALGVSEEELQWKTIFVDSGGTAWYMGGKKLPPTILQKSPYDGTRIDGTNFIADDPLYLWDYAFELNNALWDAYYFSGIGGSNPGWTDSQVWDHSSKLNADSIMRNGRFTSSGSTPPMNSPATPAIPLYRAASSLLLDGAFNINSTSEAAWVALLSSFRDVRLPTRSAGIVASGSVYSRALFPINGASTPTDGSLSETSWSGCRALSDAEIRTLAQKIVIQVREHGPFLSLADFVNRRLDVAPSGQGIPSDSVTFDAWDKRYLGVLQAAINQSKLNDRFADIPLLERTNAKDYRMDPKINRFPIAANRPPHKAAGAPGYLLQSDLLQQLGSVLTARSDTFKIRSVGRSDDGVSACVEVVVQRFPDPIIPDNRTQSAVTRVNPLPETGIPDAPPAPFGRRVKIVATRWIESSAI